MVGGLFEKPLSETLAQHYHCAAIASEMTLRAQPPHGNAESYLEKLAAEGIAARALDEYAVMLEEAVPVSRLPGFQTAWYRCRILVHNVLPIC